MKKILPWAFCFLAVLGCEARESLKQIEYQVDCTSGNVDITAFAEDGEVELSAVSVPWSHPFEAYTDTKLRLTASNLQDHGTLTAIILIDNEEYKQDRTAAAYGVVEVSGSIK